MLDLDFLLAPVSDDDPCGPDLRWDPEFTSLVNALVQSLAGSKGAVSTDEDGVPDPSDLSGLLKRTQAFSSRTKDLRLTCLLAQGAWLCFGLAGFADGIEAVVESAAAWPDAASGVHPRAEEGEDDLVERAAPLGKLLHRVPSLCATVGWGATVDPSVRADVSARLRVLFGAWSQRLEPAFGPDLPPVSEVWRVLSGLLGAAPATPAEGDDAAPAALELPGVAPDGWDLLQRALERLVEQHPHSPAVPVLRMLASWRDLDLLQIAERLGQAGLKMDAFLDALRKHQTKI